MPRSGRSPSSTGRRDSRTRRLVDAKSRGQAVPIMKMWLDHVGDEAFNLAAEPKAADYADMDSGV